MNFTHLTQFGGHFAIFALLMVVARIGLNAYDPNTEDNDSKVLNGNGAVAIRHGAFYLAFGIALFATVSMPAAATTLEGVLLESAAWGAGILVAMFSALWINDKLMLPSVNNSRAIGENNLAVAYVEAGSLLGSALIMTGTLQGTGSVLQTVIYFVIGQLAMIGMAWMYDLARKKVDYQTEIGTHGNQAAGFLIAGKTIAIALIIKNAVSGDTTTWWADITATLISFIVGFVALWLVEHIVDWLLLPGVVVDDVVLAKNSPPVLLLSAITIAVALFVTGVSPF